MLHSSATSYRFLDPGKDQNRSLKLLIRNDTENKVLGSNLLVLIRGFALATFIFPYWFIIAFVLNLINVLFSGFSDAIPIFFAYWKNSFSKFHKLRVPSYGGLQFVVNFSNFSHITNCLNIALYFMFPIKL